MDSCFHSDEFKHKFERQESTAQWSKLFYGEVLDAQAFSLRI